MPKARIPKGAVCTWSYPTWEEFQQAGAALYGVLTGTQEMDLGCQLHCGACVVTYGLSFVPHDHPPLVGEDGDEKDDTGADDKEYKNKMKGVTSKNAEERFKEHLHFMLNEGRASQANSEAIAAVQWRVLAALALRWLAGLLES